MEEWRPIKDFPHYMISNYGHVKSLSRAYVRPVPNNKSKTQTITLKEKIVPGWIKYSKSKKPVCMMVGLRRNNEQYEYRIHRLVLENFVGESPLEAVACHNDGNPLNNHLDNLRWDTQRNNIKDSYIHGTKIKPPISYGEKHHNTKITEKDVRFIRSIKYYKGLYKELGIKYKLLPITIRRIFTGESWIRLKD